MSSLITAIGVFAFLFLSPLVLFLPSQDGTRSRAKRIKERCVQVIHVSAYLFPSQDIHPVSIKTNLSAGQGESMV